MRRIITIAGNRPNLVKIDPQLKQTIIYTGQHYDKCLKDIFFKGLKIPKPKYDLGETEFGKMYDKVAKTLKKEKPDYVMVIGDTRSTVVGAMAAYQLKIPIIHLEAGCRSFNDNQIEERNRTLIDKISLIHLCPSRTAVYNLENEGNSANAFNVGSAQLSTMVSLFPTKEQPFKYQYLLATFHREETLSSKIKLKNILDALRESRLKVFFPMHPRTRKTIKEYGLKLGKNIMAVNPYSYKEMVNKIAFARQVVTDSGGIQVEAYFLHTPCITCREETEWVETVDEGFNILVGTNKERILNAINNPIKTRSRYSSNAYGAGDANINIRRILEQL